MRAIVRVSNEDETRTIMFSDFEMPGIDCLEELVMALRAGKVFRMEFNGYDCIEDLDGFEDFDDEPDFINDGETFRNLRPDRIKVVPNG